MQIAIGSIYTGKVTGLTKFGAFISFDEQKTGMVHISEISSSYVEDIRDQLTEGQEVKVKVIAIGDDGKISLSIKKALPDSEKSPPVRKARDQKPRNEFWQAKPKAEPQDFEEMMLRFKQNSDEKISDLKRSTDGKHGSYSKRK